MKRSKMSESLRTGIAALLFLLVVGGCIFLPPVLVRASDRTLLSERYSENLEDSFSVPQNVLPLMEKLTMMYSDNISMFPNESGKGNYRFTEESAREHCKAQLALLRELGILPYNTLDGVNPQFDLLLPIVYMNQEDPTRFFVLWHISYQDEAYPWGGDIILDDETGLILGLRLLMKTRQGALPTVKAAAEGWGRYLGITALDITSDIEGYRAGSFSSVKYRQDEDELDIILEVNEYEICFNMERYLLRDFTYNSMTPAKQWEISIY